MCTTKLPVGIPAGYTKHVTVATHKTVALLQWCCHGNKSYHSLGRGQWCWDTEGITITSCALKLLHYASSQFSKPLASFSDLPHPVLDHLTKT